MQHLMCMGSLKPGKAHFEDLETEALKETSLVQGHTARAGRNGISAWQAGPRLTPSSNNYNYNYYHFY